MSKTKYIILIALLTFTACAGPYTYKDNGSSIELSVDDTFQVILEGEANTGYSWQLVEPNSFVELESPPTLKTKGNVIEYTFSFKAVEQGKETMSLVYSNDKDVKKSFELLVVIGTLGPIL